MVQYLLTGSIVLIGVGLVSGAGAENQGISRLLGKSEQPIHIQAEKLVAENQSGILIFTGQVLVRQGNLIISADRIEAYFEPKIREVNRIVARGNVRMSQKDWIGVGEKADYDVGRGVLILTGSPRIWQGEDQVEGERIKLDISRDRFEVESAQARVGSKRLEELKRGQEEGSAGPGGKPRKAGPGLELTESSGLVFRAEDLHKSYRAQPGSERGFPLVEARRDSRPPRPERSGQDDHFLPFDGAGPSRAGEGFSGRRGFKPKTGFLPGPKGGRLPGPGTFNFQADDGKKQPAGGFRVPGIFPLGKGKPGRGPAPGPGYFPPESEPG